MSLFAELFNEMLMRDFGFGIYKSLLVLPDKPKEDKKKDHKVQNMQWSLSGYRFVEDGHLTFEYQSQLSRINLVLRRPPVRAVCVSRAFLRSMSLAGWLPSSSSTQAS